jgi:3-oxoacyl-[acyl-carrier-protein] synthase II
MPSAESPSSIVTCRPVRIAISGIGMVTPGGPDRESSWQTLVAGRSCLRWLTEEEHFQAGCNPMRTRLAGAPAILSAPGKHTAPSRYAPANSLTSFDQMLVQAAEEAAVDAKVDISPAESTRPGDQIDRHRIGLVIGTSKSSLAAIRQGYLETFRPNGGQDSSTCPSPLGREMCPDWWPNVPASRLAVRWDVRGPVLTPVAACATGMASLCRGAELIRDGVCDMVFAGSVDDSISEIIWGSYRRLGVLARIQNDDPATACRPFDRDRTGLLMGAGAAVIVLERWDAAMARGLRPYAEWLAGGTLSDSMALTQVSPDAAGLTRLIKDLLRRGNVAAGELDYLNLHGTGTRENDRYETLGIRQALGQIADQIPCSSLKGTIGHLLGGAGSVEFAATILALRDGIIPPTCNLEHSSPDCDLDYTPQIARRKNMQTALKVSLGFGGHLVGGLIRRA